VYVTELISCRYCGPIPVDVDLPLVDQIHAHALSDGHKQMMELDGDMDRWLAPR